MKNLNDNEEYEEAISSYYEGRGVSSIISLKVDTKEADGLAEKLEKYENLEDVFLVTGDVDIIVKARFQDYDHMKKFLLGELSEMEGVDDVSSQMIITTYKERGEKIISEEDEED